MRKKAIIGTTLLICCLLSLGSSIFFGSKLINDSEATQAALGADLIIVPSGYPSTTTIPIVVGEAQNNYLQTGAWIEKIRALPGIKAVSPQLYIMTMQEDCCSPEVKVYGFDPGSDWAIQGLLATGKWENQPASIQAKTQAKEVPTDTASAQAERTKEAAATNFATAEPDAVSGTEKSASALPYEGVCIVGAAKMQQLGDSINLLGATYKVVGKLVPSGNTELEHAVFIDMEQARKLATLTKRGTKHPAVNSENLSFYLLLGDGTKPLKTLQREVAALLPEDTYVLQGSNQLYYAKQKALQARTHLRTLTALSVAAFVFALFLFFFLLKWLLANKGEIYASSEEKMGGSGD